MEDLSHLKLIPGDMSLYPYVEKEGNIYTVISQESDENDEEMQLVCFDGYKWIVI